MNEVVRNERLVIRQKLVLFHKNELEETARRLEATWSQRCRLFEQDRSSEPYDKLIAAASRDDYNALLVYDASGRRLYPLLSADTGGVSGPFAVLADAWQLEFVERNYAEAAARYEQHARSASGYRRRIAALVGQTPPLDDRGLLDALIGQGRSLAKLGRISDALDVCRQATTLSPLAETGDSEILSRIADARLLMLSWMKDRTQFTDKFTQTLDELLAMLYVTNEAGFALNADHNLFVARKALELAQNSLAETPRTIRVQGVPLTTLVAMEQRCLKLAERFPAGASFETWPADELQPLGPAEPNAYGFVHRSRDRSYLAVLSDRSIRAALRDYADAFDNDYVSYRIVDEGDKTVAGTTQPTGEPFAAGPVGACFPGWRIDLFFREGDILDKAASEQIAIYTWTGTLVILLILGSGVLAAKSIGRQVKLNRLKNDFIATVTHELKTPLASMRVLVDTLIDGSYHDPKQATEYLQLVSKENERLSRLIDNFLTFSRMERNKQAFQMRRTSPIVIARTAAEAVKTKFDRAGCCLEMVIGDDIPDVTADADAMVTVLVNLLDNACKYSYDDKKIRLNVYGADGSVCFAVTDNGVGIPRRALKRVFKRFYQVDRSLSRRAEGCGLGLSIARFIVDAHTGSIKVDSKPGHGSTFTVRLPAV
jgi:signal transduction histidine kinase